MNSHGTTGPIPTYYRNANPLLYTLQQDHMNIQPYWIMVLQILTFQLLIRTWNLCFHGAFLTSLEFGFIQSLLIFQKENLEKNLKDQEDLLDAIPGESEAAIRAKIRSLSVYLEETKEKMIQYDKKLQFDLFDLLLSTLPLLGHTVWYCYIQSSCMSAEQATVWRCYNAFGYRLFNYIFLSYCNFYYSFAVKSGWFILKRTLEIPIREKFATMFEKFSFYLSGGSFTIVYWFTTALFTPYLITHLLPMIAAYAFMSVIYFTLCSAIGFFTIFLLSKIPILKHLMPIPRVILLKYHLHTRFLYIIALSCYTYPILLTTSYNYSQYLYYGENYIETMTNEFNSRDSAIYFAIFRNSVNERFHSFLSFI